jgi:quercetin dioxygenase-like cupin family protein
MLEGKVWGETDCIFSSESVSVHFLVIKKGGYSSKHRHVIKGNVFHVLRGSLVVREWSSDLPNAIVDETILRAGQKTLVGPTRWHQFEALEDSEIIEVYGAFLSEPDIEREGHGGVACEAELKAKKKKSE